MWLTRVKSTCSNFAQGISRCDRLNITCIADVTQGRGLNRHQAELTYQRANLQTRNAFTHAVKYETRLLYTLYLKGTVA